jgi:FkbM family methyltransferase
MKLYAQMHAEGEKRLGIAPEATFPGSSLAPHVGRIKRLIDATGARTILDYGSGKGFQYRPQKIVIDGRHVADSIAEYWDVDEVRCYDPGLPAHAALPENPYDGVISTDVLEHCPEEDLAWILDEIFALARSFAYLNVACFPARKSLPNGENAHITLRPPSWWRDLVAERAARFPALQWQLSAAEFSAGQVKETMYSSTEAHDGIALVDIEGRSAQFHVPNDKTRWRAQTLYTKEPVTIEWLRSMPTGSTFVDVGANVGMYSIFAAMARGAHVIAFEPESQNYALLNANINRNGLGDRVKAYCAALSDRPVLEPLYLSFVSAGGSCHSLGKEVGFDLRPRTAAYVQGCVALRFDDLWESGQVPLPHYVKIDVDGFEHKVVQGMANALRQPALRSLLIELNPAIPEHLTMRSALEEAGFRWAPEQVERSTRREGAFTGVAEYVFSR